MIGDTLLVFFPRVTELPNANPAAIEFRNGHPVLAFDATTQETVIFSGIMPRHYGGNQITVYLHWIAAVGVVAGTVGWDIAFERVGSGQQDLDADGFAAAQTVAAVTVDATSGNVVVSSLEISVLDSIAASEAFRLRIRRDVANDDAAGDAQLLAVELVEGSAQSDGEGVSPSMSHSRSSSLSPSVSPSASPSPSSENGFAPLTTSQLSLAGWWGTADNGVNNSEFEYSQGVVALRYVNGERRVILCGFGQNPKTLSGWNTQNLFECVTPATYAATGGTPGGGNLSAQVQAVTGRQWPASEWHTIGLEDHGNGVNINAGWWDDQNQVLWCLGNVAYGTTAIACLWAVELHDDQTCQRFGPWMYYGGAAHSSGTKWRNWDWKRVCQYLSPIPAHRQADFQYRTMFVGGNLMSTGTNAHWGPGLVAINLPDLTSALGERLGATNRGTSTPANQFIITTDLDLSSVPTDGTQAFWFGAHTQTVANLDNPPSSAWPYVLVPTDIVDNQDGTWTVTGDGTASFPTTSIPVGEAVDWCVIFEWGDEGIPVADYSPTHSGLSWPNFHAHREDDYYGAQDAHDLTDDPYFAGRLGIGWIVMGGASRIARHRDICATIGSTSLTYTTNLQGPFGSDGALVDYLIEFEDGATRTVLTHDADTLTVTYSSLPSPKPWTLVRFYPPAQGGGTGYIDLHTSAGTEYPADGQLEGWKVRLVATNEIQAITAWDANTQRAAVAGWSGTPPTAGSFYELFFDHTENSSVVAASAGTITLQAAIGDLTGTFVRVYGEPGNGAPNDVSYQVRRITGLVSGNQWNVDADWTVTPNANCTYTVQVPNLGPGEHGVSTMNSQSGQNPSPVGGVGFWQSQQDRAWGATWVETANYGGVLCFGVQAGDANGVLDSVTWYHSVDTYLWFGVLDKNWTNSADGTWGLKATLLRRRVFGHNIDNLIGAVAGTKTFNATDQVPYDAGDWSIYNPPTYRESRAFPGYSPLTPETIGGGIQASVLDPIVHQLIVGFTQLYSPGGANYKPLWLVLDLPEAAVIAAPSTKDRANSYDAAWQ
jgi:hypothetical protein